MEKEENKPINDNIYEIFGGFKIPVEPEEIIPDEAYWEIELDYSKYNSPYFPEEHENY